jgi:TrpR-related protein YerC/YecD
MQQVLDVSNEVAAELAGVEDGVLDALRERLQCTIALRGNRLTLGGDDEHVVAARAVVDELVDLVEGGHQIGPDTVGAVLSALDQAEDVRAFLQDLCTPAELEAMADRWRVVPYLRDRVPYREIHEETKVSVTTIGRVARTLEQGAGGYRIAIKRAARAPRKSNP